MTDPNPLKQAAEEAKARKLAEVVQREADGAAREHAEAPFPGLLLLTKPAIHNACKGNLEELASLNLIRLDRIHPSVRQFFEEALRLSPAVGSGVAVVVPKRGMSYDEFHRTLRENGLSLANLRLLMSHPFPLRNRTFKLHGRALATASPVGATFSPYLAGDSAFLDCDRVQDSTEIMPDEAFLVEVSQGAMIRFLEVQRRASTP
jgi:hypothetical protein